MKPPVRIYDQLRYLTEADRADERLAADPIARFGCVMIVAGGLILAGLGLASMVWTLVR